MLKSFNFLWNDRNVRNSIQVQQANARLALSHNSFKVKLIAATLRRSLVRS